MTRDPGLQPERTALAWSRTGLLFAANAVLFMRSGLQARGWVLVGLGVFLAAVAGWLALRGESRKRELGRALPAALPRRSLGAVSTLTLVAAVAVFWID